MSKCKSATRVVAIDCDWVETHTAELIVRVPANWTDKQAVQWCEFNLPVRKMAVATEYYYCGVVDDDDSDHVKIDADATEVVL